LTIFKATVLLPRCSCPSSFARWQMAKPPLPSCGPVSYCRPSGSRTTSGGGSAWIEGADIWRWNVVNAFALRVNEELRVDVRLVRWSPSPWQRLSRSARVRAPCLRPDPRQSPRGTLAHLPRNQSRRNKILNCVHLRVLKIRARSCALCTRSRLRRAAVTVDVGCVILRGCARQPPTGPRPAPARPLCIEAPSSCRKQPPMIWNMFTLQ
jgi:hypothetical protein